MTGPRPEAPIPHGDIPTAESARLTGVRLAEHPLLAARQGDDRPSIEDVLDDARPLLSTYGIAFELLRTRPGLLVLRARSDGRTTPQVCCELVKGLVGTLAGDVCAVNATLIENTCAQRGAPACLYSLMWEVRPAAERRPTPPPPPETLIDPPLETGPGDWAPPVDIPAPTPPPEPEEYELPQWDPPVPAGRFDVASTSEPAVSAPNEAPGQSTVTRAPLPSTPVPTVSTSSGYQVQMSTQQAMVPAPAPPVTAPAPPPVTPPTSAGPEDRGGPQAPGARARRNLPRGLLRRSWLLASALLAGSAGGWFAGRHAGTSYGAQATVLVQSGAGKTGPGSANDALALATTYSAVIPKDQEVLSMVASAVLGTNSSTVASALSVTVQNDTSILVVSYTASTPGSALRGAQVVAQLLGSDRQITPAIAPGSLADVSLPTVAHRQGTLHKYGIVIGAFLGLIVGLILVLAAERADPRIDDAPTMAAATGCRAAQVPADISHAELARVLSDLGRIEGSLTVVPLAVDDTASTMELARGLRPCWPADGPAVAISPSFASGVVELSRGSGPTVLVTHTGARQRDVVAAADRLRMIDRAPIWAVLAAHRLRPRGRGRVG